MRPGAPGPVAHKAGWLTTIENDLAVAFGPRGGPCFVGVTSSGVSLAAASRFTRRVLPALLADATSFRSLARSGHRQVGNPVRGGHAAMSF